jgi:hypothetical protein
MVAAAGSANALEYQFGGVQVYFDTTVSAGVSVRAAERNDLFLPEGNGGPVESRADVLTFNGLTTALNPGGGRVVTLDTQAGTDLMAPGTFDPFDRGDNYDGSINTDDGRLNFDQWDLTSGVIKMTNDIQASWQNYTLFARVNSFYDAVLDSDSSYDRSEIGDGAKTDAARDIDLLDLYVSADYNVGDLPLNLRLGRQVINWGEGTFILNGINTIAPLDVNAFRRPGAEIKEGLLPIWAAYGSIGLPYNLALEGFYQLEWEEIQIDRPGTPFADSDVVLEGSLAGGNQFATSFIGGGPTSGTFRRNCDLSSAVNAAIEGAYTAAGLNNRVCGATGTNPFVDYRTNFPIGTTEFNRLANGDLNTLERIADREASDSGQYGLALRWYSEELNSTEFGFYFMNYHSRLPLVSLRAGSPQVGTSTVGEDSTLLTRGVLGQGCTAADARQTAAGAPQDFGAVGLNALISAVDPVQYAAIQNTLVNDPAGLLSNTSPLLALAQGVYDSLTPHPTRSTATNPLNSANLGIAGATAAGTLARATAINCALALAQGVAGTPDFNMDGNGDFDGILADGAETLTLHSQHSLFLEYPEDIKLYGMSFNTTVGDWGVQGEVAFRTDQPLQLDTDQLTIASGTSQCALPVSASDATLQFDALNTYGLGVRCGGGNGSEITGFTREEVLTAQIGTTATYTNSNPLIGFLGSDLGILVTEVGTMWVPDVPDEEGAGQNNGPRRLSNVCTAGTDLPLGGLLALDPRSGCRPTSFSWGYVLLGQLQYNNAFGTPITLNPTIAWQHDVAGNSPAPLSNYREGRKRVSLALNGSYQSSWRGGISYTNFFGNEKYSRDGDRDFVSVNLSYSF